LVLSQEFIMMHGHLNVKFAMSDVEDTRNVTQNAKKASVSVFIGLRRRLGPKFFTIFKRRDVRGGGAKMKTL